MSIFLPCFRSADRGSIFVLCSIAVLRSTVALHPIAYQRRCAVRCLNVCHHCHGRFGVAKRAVNNQLDQGCLIKRGEFWRFSVMQVVHLELHADGGLSQVTNITVTNFRSEDDNPRKFAFGIGYQSITERAFGRVLLRASRCRQWTGRLACLIVPQWPIYPILGEYPL
jgi:hypothetical protein